MAALGHDATQPAEIRPPLPRTQPGAATNWQWRQGETLGAESESPEKVNRSGVTESPDSSAIQTASGTTSDMLLDAKKSLAGLRRSTCWRVSQRLRWKCTPEPARVRNNRALAHLRPVHAPLSGPLTVLYACLII